MKHTTAECEDTIEHLSNLKISKVESKSQKSNSHILEYAKKNCAGIAFNINVISNWPKDASIKDYNKLHKHW